MQTIIGGGRLAPNTGSITYTHIQGGGYPSALTIFQHYWTLVPVAGTLSNLFIDLATAPGSGKSWTYTLIKNGVATNLTATISGTDTTGSDSSHEVSLSPGDLIYLKIEPSSGPASGIARWTFDFDAGNSSMIQGCPLNATTSTQYFPLMSSIANTGVSESVYQEVIPVDGVLQNLYAARYQTTGDLPLTVRINGADSSLVATITDGNDSANNTADSEPVSAGDIVSMKVGMAAGVSSSCCWGVEFVPDDAGNIVILQSPLNLLDDDGYYHFVCAEHQTDWAAGYATKQQVVNEMDIANLYVHLTAPPGSGKSRTFTLYKNGSPTAAVVTISNFDTDGVAANSVALSQGDLITVKHEFDSGVAASYCAYALTQEFSVSHAYCFGQVIG